MCVFSSADMCPQSFRGGGLFCFLLTMFGLFLRKRGTEDLCGSAFFFLEFSQKGLKVVVLGVEEDKDIRLKAAGDKKIRVCQDLEVKCLS